MKISFIDLGMEITYTCCFLRVDHSEKCKLISKAKMLSPNNTAFLYTDKNGLWYPLVERVKDDDFGRSVYRFSVKKSDDIFSERFYSPTFTIENPFNDCRERIVFTDTKVNNTLICLELLRKLLEGVWHYARELPIEFGNAEYDKKRGVLIYNKDSQVYLKSSQKGVFFFEVNSPFERQRQASYPFRVYGLG